MSCRQTHLLKRLSVADRAALQTEPWQRHLRQCSMCRDELAAEERALALFRHVSAEDVERAQAPSWADLAGALEREQRRTRLHRVLRVSAVAAVTFAVGLTGTMTLWEGRQPVPAQIVRLQPAQQTALEDALRNNLANSRVEYVVDRNDALPIAARRNMPRAGGGAIVHNPVPMPEGFIPRANVTFFGPDVQSSRSPLVTPVSNTYTAGR